jgi:hypothetical protein
MKANWFPIRERDLPFDDIDGKSVEFLLSGKQYNEGFLAGVGKFDQIPCTDGLVRLEIRREFSCGCLDRIPMRPVFLSGIKRNPPGSKTEFTLHFRR